MTKPANRLVSPHRPLYEPHRSRWHGRIRAAPRPDIHSQPLFVAKAERAALDSETRISLVHWAVGAGKSTVAIFVERQLHRGAHHATLLDGDNIRHGLCRDLGFTEADRVANIHRAGEGRGS